MNGTKNRKAMYQNKPAIVKNTSSMYVYTEPRKWSDIHSCRST